MTFLLRRLLSLPFKAATALCMHHRYTCFYTGTYKCTFTAYPAQLYLHAGLHPWAHLIIQVVHHTSRWIALFFPISSPHRLGTAAFAVAEGATFFFGQWSSLLLDRVRGAFCGFSICSVTTRLAAEHGRIITSSGDDTASVYPSNRNLDRRWFWQSGEVTRKVLIVRSWVGYFFCCIFKETRISQVHV